LPQCICRLLAGTGTSIPELFRILGQETEEYGEIAKEAEKISRDIETFGMDVSEALEKAAKEHQVKTSKNLYGAKPHHQFRRIT